MVARVGSGVLVIWQDVAEETEEMVNDWYDREHHAERVDVPGFQSARRYLALSGSPRYFIYYMTDSPAVLASQPYVQRINDPTPWTREMLPFFRNNSRTVCRQVQHCGRGEGGIVCPVCVSPDSKNRRSLQQWLCGRVLQEAIRYPGVISGALWLADPELTRIPSEERALRHGEDDIAKWIVLLSGTREDYLNRVVEDLLSPDRLRHKGATTATKTGLYRLLFSLHGDRP